MLRLFGAQSTAVGKTVENFPPQWRAAAQWKSRGAETLVALQAQSPSGLKKAAQALRQAFSADLYGAGRPLCLPQWWRRWNGTISCLSARMLPPVPCWKPGENLPGAEKVFDFGAVSYANPKTGPLIEKRARLPKDCTDPLRQALARAQAARRVVGADLSAACAERENDCVLVLSCRKGCFLRTVPAGRTLPSGCWISFGARRQTSLRLRGQASCLPAGLQEGCSARPSARAASPAPGVHDAVGAGSAGGSRCGRGVGIYQRQFLRPAGTAAHPADGARSRPGRHWYKNDPLCHAAARRNTASGMAQQ